VTGRQGRLERVAARLERVATNPGALRGRWTWLERPILRVLDWKPKVTIDAVRQALAAMQEAGRSGDAGPWLDESVDAALQELEANVAQVERAGRLHGRAPVAYAAWLWRVHEVLRRSVVALEKPEAWRLHAAGISDVTSVLPPMLLADGRTSEAFQLSAIDQLLDAARAESDLLGRRRRLLEAAREMLLDVSAALPLDAADVTARHRYLAREIALIDRLQAAGIEPEVALVHQVRQALTRGERQRLAAGLSALQDAAARRGDEAVGQLSHGALTALWRGSDRFSDGARAESVRASAAEVLGEDVVERIRGAYDLARREIDSLRGNRKISEGFITESDRFLEYGCHDATLAASLAADGWFDVGVTLSPVRVVEHEVRARTVRYPTPDLVLVPAERVEDIPDALVEDPRLLLLDLATGRLLARRYMKEELYPVARVVQRGEAVRIYLLDGSGSMLNSRGRMRDAILLAELATLRERLAEGARVVLFFRYFDDQLHPTVKVDSPESAVAAIEHVLGTVRAGGTDIQKALLASFDQIREARHHDPELARAQVVLITDGNAPVDEAELWEARQQVRDLPVAVSMIALGEENPALRALAAKQRERGERVFYHFVADDELEQVVAGQQDGGRALHLPARAPALVRQDDELESLLDTLVTELESLERKRDLESLERADDLRIGWLELHPLGDEPLPLTDGERSRIAAAHRDRVVLDTAYERWFPRVEVPRHTMEPEVGSDDDRDLEALRVVLATVADVTDLVGGAHLSRKADAIELVERLLGDACLTPWRYADLVERYPTQTRDALAPVHAAVELPATVT
jgi:hypothetical protein